MLAVLVIGEQREAFVVAEVLAGFLSLVKEDVKAKKLDGIPFTYVAGAPKASGSSSSGSRPARGNVSTNQWKWFSDHWLSRAM